MACSVTCPLRLFDLAAYYVMSPFEAYEEWWILCTTCVSGTTTYYRASVTANRGTMCGEDPYHPSLTVRIYYYNIIE